MNTRLIFVTNDKRAASLQAQYQLEENSIRPDNHLFILKEISSKQKELLKIFVDELTPLIQFVSQGEDKIILKVLPEHSLLTSMKNNNIDDLELTVFFNSIVNYFTAKPKKRWKVGHSYLDFSGRPLIMGILNVTPDSFSDGGRFIEKQKAIERGLEMIEHGADIIDIGGESTRPGAEQVQAAEELQRVIPVIEGIKKYSKIFISIDTYKSLVAKEAIEAGADIINDISGTVFDERMKGVIEKKKCPLILAHIKGTPKNMQVNPKYNDLHEEVYRFLQKKCVDVESLNNGKIILDPGIGFGKSISHNLKLIRDIKDFTFLAKPILIGVSRKSFIGKILGTNIDKRLTGSLASEIYSYLHGVDILRVHDIEETVHLKNILNKILTA